MDRPSIKRCLAAKFCSLQRSSSEGKTQSQGACGCQVLGLLWCGLLDAGHQHHHPGYDLGESKAHRACKHEPAYDFGESKAQGAWTHEPAYDFGESKAHRACKHEPDYNFGESKPQRAWMHEPAWRMNCLHAFSVDELWSWAPCKQYHSMAYVYDICI
eukprot:1141844-Pelagomonas_calceolata.AAC.4